MSNELIVLIFTPVGYILGYIFMYADLRFKIWKNKNKKREPLPEYLKGREIIITIGGMEN